MKLTINENQVKGLIEGLDNYKKAGLSMEESVHSLYQANYPAAMASIQGKSVEAFTPDLPNAAELALALSQVFEETTPLNLAVLTKELFGTPVAVVQSVQAAFPDYSALEMGTLLLNDQLYPQLTSEGMQEALNAGSYTNEQISQAVDSLYKSAARVVNVNFSQPTISTTNATVQTGPGTMFNSYYKKSWIMHNPGASFIKIDFEHVKKGFSKINLIMLHLTSMTGGHSGNSPIDILINGKMFKSNYNVVNGNYQTDTFDATDFLVEGKNSILLNFCNGSSTNYWIQNLTVDYLK